MGKQLAEIHPALTMLGELPGASKKLATLLDHIVEVDLTGEVLQVVLGQLRLGVTQVHVTRAPLHEHRDHRRRLRSVNRGTWLQVKNTALEQGLGRCSQETFLLHQGCHCQSPEPECLLGKEITASEACHRGRPLFNVKKSIGTYQGLAQMSEGNLLRVGKVRSHRPERCSLFFQENQGSLLFSV